MRSAEHRRLKRGGRRGLSERPKAASSAAAASTEKRREPEGRVSRVAFSLDTFFWRSKRKYLGRGTNSRSTSTRVSAQGHRPASRSAIGLQARPQANTDAAYSPIADFVASATVARSQAADSARARQGAGDKSQLCWRRNHRPTNCAGRLCINAAIPSLTSSLAINGAKSGSSRAIAASSP